MCDEPDMHAGEKSDEGIVPRKSANEGPPEPVENIGTERPEESMEGRPSIGGNAANPLSHRTQGRTSVAEGIRRVREAARKDKRARFTSLLHHVSREALTQSYRDLNRMAAAGVDRLTWEEYGRGLEGRIESLHEKVHRGSYRPLPSRRVYIEKASGGQRPLGIAAIEDKIVQHAVSRVLTAIYEVDFCGFSYGYRPAHNAHQALDALWVALTRKNVNWVLDADIRGFFDSLDHECLMRFLEHRIGDRRLLDLVQRWLRAGVMDGGDWSETKLGTPQGAVISPLLANVYLHYVLDLWVREGRKNAKGEIVIVRYADDFVLGFEHRSTAESCLALLRVRMAKFGLALHADKTRLIEFGRQAARDRQLKADVALETFDFLGFTHYWGKTRKGLPHLKRKPIAKRVVAKLKQIKDRLLAIRHYPLRGQGRWLRQVVQGWLHYFAVPDTTYSLTAFRTAIRRLWIAALRRRGDRRPLSWARFHRVCDRWLPRIRILHPWPSVRFDARTSDKSRVR